MTTMIGNSSGLRYFPTEVLMHIFTFSTPKTLSTCRIVCSRWQHIIDRLQRTEKLWLNHCRRDYPDIWQSARLKSEPGLCWYQLYRSLTIWPKLPLAQEIKNEFAVAENSRDEIRDFQVLSKGVIGVHRRKTIEYYNLNTLKRIQERTITGSYFKYCENDDTFLVLCHNLHLSVTTKLATDSRSEPTVIYDKVKYFVLLGNTIYYVTLDNEIYLCELLNGKITRTMLKHVPNGVMSLGVRNGYLHILTFHCTIHILVNGELRNVEKLETSPNIFYEIRKYNFLKQIEWRLYFQCYASIGIPNETLSLVPWHEIITMYSYGHVVFTGSNWGILRIYYSPDTDDLSDLLKSEPLKQYNFGEKHELVISMCPIIRIDVVEGNDSHTVIVAMPKKIAVLKFTHDFTRSDLLSNSKALKVKS